MRYLVSTLLFLTTWFTTFSVPATAQSLVVDTTTHHIRNAGNREWSEFAEHAEANSFQVTFEATPNETEYTLALRQYDVRSRWLVILNKDTLGSLIEDEKDLVALFRIAPRVLQTNNAILITTRETRTDDISVGDVRILPYPQNEYLTQGSIDIEVIDGDSGRAMPSRITIVNESGTLQTVSVPSSGMTAVRPGYVYTATGKATISLPEGTYTFYATRGTEYGVDSTTVAVRAGTRVSRSLKLTREVDTRGWISCDPHIHTFTWSRHGDATREERAVTIAGEGIELPVLTDHNVHADLTPDTTLLEFYSVIKGNEITTAFGHFNIFPVAGDKPVDHRIRNWRELSDRIGNNQSQVIILNHARDIHQGFRPFDPTKHVSIAGMRMDGWSFPANAMEIINSGSQQTDQTQLTHDWFGMLNGGYAITPVGSSDSHDVSRFLVGQARTYVRASRDVPRDINHEETLNNFIEGNVTVSFGLFANIEINDSYGPGELVPSSDEVKVIVSVMGPAWSVADKVSLYANGIRIREAAITNGSAAGVKWQEEWIITMPAQDIFLVAVAEGPDRKLPFWPIAKPYQPMGEEWQPRVFAVTGAVWLDGDRNGKRNSAREYAVELIRESGGNIPTLVQRLSAFNQSIAIQAAALLHQRGKNLESREVLTALERASADTRSAFERVISEIRLRRQQ